MTRALAAQRTADDEYHPQVIREGRGRFRSDIRLAGNRDRRDACAVDAHHSLFRGGDSGGRAWHLDHLQCRRRPGAARRMRRCDCRLLPGGRAHDRFLAHVRLLAACDRLRPGTARPARSVVFRREGLDLVGRGRASADRAVAPLLGRAELRPRAGPQPRGLGSASENFVHHEGGRADPLCRHHHLGRTPTRSVRGDHAQRIRSISCN